MAWLWATEVFTTWPAELVTTTKSPPTTGRFLYVRSYGTYCVPLKLITACWVNLSFALACSAAGLAATKSVAALAASVDALGAALGACCASADKDVNVATPAASTPAEARAITRLNLDDMNRTPLCRAQRPRALDRGSHAVKSELVRANLVKN